MQPKLIPASFPANSVSSLPIRFSWTTGSHSLKFGVDADRTEDYLKQLFNQYGGLHLLEFRRFRQRL